MATMIAMASGASQDGIARGIGAVKAGLFLILIEALVWLSVPAMALLKMPTASRDAATAATITAPIRRVANPSPARGLRGGNVYYMARLQRDHPALAKQVDDGELSVYAASIQAGIRKAPAKSKWTTIDAYLPETADA